MSPIGHSARSAAAGAARRSYGRLLALLAGAGDVASAEDALADALERALRTWPDQGVPSNPDGWLLTVARNRLRDGWRSAERRLRSEPSPDSVLAVDVAAPLDSLDPDTLPDQRLELMLVCAHPAIAPRDRAPLMLNTVLGFTAAEIARAFAVPTATMATRLVRAKQRIRTEGIPFVVPGRTELPARMDAVLEAVYGAYVIDWSTGPSPRALPSGALDLAEVLAGLVPDDPEAQGLAALVQLSAARVPARSAPDGTFVPLAEQDPSRWDRALIEAAHAHLRTAHARGTLGSFQLEAAIQALHCARVDGRPVDWHTVRSLHEALRALAPSHGNLASLAAAIAEDEGPAAGLALLDEHAEGLRRFQPAWATRAELLARLGRREEAVAAYDRAIALTHVTAERVYLALRQAGCRGAGAPAPRGTLSPSR